MNSWNHAQSAARKWGGRPEDYIAIHEFVDSSKKIIGDVRHRSMYHHTTGVWLCQEVFGRTITVTRPGSAPRPRPPRPSRSRTTRTTRTATGSDYPENSYDLTIDSHPTLGTRRWDNTLGTYVGITLDAETQARHERCAALAYAIESGAFDDVLLEAFGDHARVTVRRDRIVVDEYSHD